MTLFSAFSLPVRNAFGKNGKPFKKKETTMPLLPPALDGKISVERAIKGRRTIRSFSDRKITRKQLSQLCWAGQGVTEDNGFKRASPSAGALYPADIYVVVGEGCVEKTEAGVYHYDSKRHVLEKKTGEDRRGDVAVAALSQMWMAEAPVQFVVTVEFSRITIKYRERGIRYALMEVGHIAQNILLQCRASGLEGGIVGAFHDAKVAELINAKENHDPLIILPVGYRG